MWARPGFIMLPAMNESAKARWKERILEETVEYLVNVSYLMLFFTLFTWYRRLILAEYGIGYFHYGAAIIEAVVLAKIVTVGGFLKFGRSMEHRSLIFPTLHKTVVFSICVGLVGVLEHAARGLILGQGIKGGLEELIHLGKYELLAKCLVTFCAFIPFFAFRELGRVLGKGKIRELFFKRTEATDARLFQAQSAG